VGKEQKYQLAIGMMGLFLLLMLYKLWADGVLFDTSVKLKLPDWINDLFHDRTKQDEFDTLLSEQGRSVGLLTESEVLEESVEDDNSKTGEEWGEIATSAIAGAIIIGFIAYLAAGPAGIAFGIAIGIGAGGMIGLIYTELKEKAKRDAARGQLLASMIALPGTPGPAGEMPSD